MTWHDKDDIGGMIWHDWLFLHTHHLIHLLKGERHHHGESLEECSSNGGCSEQTGRGDMPVGDGSKLRLPSSPSSWQSSHRSTGQTDGQGIEFSILVSIMWAISRCLYCGHYHPLERGLDKKMLSCHRICKSNGTCASLVNNSCKYI